MPLPEQFRHYIEFCTYREDGEKRGRIDLTRCNFIHPATLLPLFAFASIKGWVIEVDAVTPVGGYLSYMLGRTRKAKALSYIAPVKLPRNYNDCDRVLKSLYDMKSKSILFGKNKDAYHYVIGELVDNIYEHSEFSFASVMAQKYNRFGAIELCFFDNGITIPGSYKKLGLDYVPARHFKAILKAVEGVSTKPETGRGYGLSSNVQMFRHAGGRILIVSGHGAAFIDRFGIHPYMLRPDHALSGTLISLSVPDRALNLNIYEYLEK